MKKYINRSDTINKDLEKTPKDNGDLLSSKRK